MARMTVNERGGLLLGLTQAGSEPSALQRLAMLISTPAGWNEVFYAVGVDRKALAGQLMQLAGSPIRDARLAHCLFFGNYSGVPIWAR
jgi:hypothetical protein